MAMNKKEQAELAQAKLDAMINRALRWTDPVQPDLMPPKPISGEQDIRGYVYNTHNMRVDPAWSSSAYHSIGSHERKNYHASQGACQLYSTRLLALRALRSAKEIEVAKQLANIDMLIAAELNKTED